ncbi:hypothetical protein NDU88_006008 [Pleurodeles waltl]|uniref:Uncharacterized protein n=1 Tax=Pleurodeles waltl TaxID=8319 RepID=A0AAV7SNK5_PLEWA|nr:hypothetical protein NDU88_006008 [Pleurodeles waltl]
MPESTTRNHTLKSRSANRNRGRPHKEAPEIKPARRRRQKGARVGANCPAAPSSPNEASDFIKRPARRGPAPSQSMAFSLAQALYRD